MALNQGRMPRVDASRFSMTPRADIPRSRFVTTHTHKTTFDAGYLVPIEVAEVLPGDVHKGEVTIFARLSNLLFPVMDHMTLETFFFFVPIRLVWDNFVKMMGERANPSDSISYSVPVIASAGGDGVAVGSVYDYFGIPPFGQVSNQIFFNALPFRAYNLIWNEWFRDQNLQNQVTVRTTDSGDLETDFTLLRRNKKHDYFTSALPWPLKGGVDITLPLAGEAPITGLAIDEARTPTAGNPPLSQETGSINPSGWAGYYTGNTAAALYIRSETTGLAAPPAIYADLSQATGATINALRLAVQTQRLLERDARSGTRYTELLRAHFGVTPEDQRLQRPEYIGGGRSSVQTQAIPQTSATGLTGGTSPQGSLSGQSTIADEHRYQYHATEHGYIIGLAHVTADITYQQGLHRMWTRSTRYDFYWPAFAHLGEQAIRNDEIYVQGTAADDDVFGYQERWAEYRHRPSRISGLFRGTSAGNIDTWHLAQEFTALPTLNSTFIQDTPPLSRVLAAGAAANGMQILFDSVFTINSTRPMPMYSVPGMIDRF